MAINDFYIKPAGSGFADSLAGLGKILVAHKEAEAAKAEKAAAEQRQREMMGAAFTAFQSSDPEAWAGVVEQYPEAAEMAMKGLGISQDYQKQEMADFAMKALSNPQGAKQLAEQRIATGTAQGRNMSDTQEFLDILNSDPEAASKYAEMALISADPDKWKLFNESRKAGDLGVKVVGDYLVDSSGKLLFDGSGAKSGTAEHGLTPLVFRNPETGAYQAYLPTKEGTMTPLDTPEGLQYVPDSGRLGYNPTNILERSAAETQAERIKAMPAAQRAMVRRQQQATLVDDTIDRAMEKADSLTTGFVGNIMKNLPGSDAADMKNLLDTIKANIGFDKLQEMREASPTGAALGAISDFENRMLQSVISSLEQSQSKEQFMQNLELVRETFRNIVHGSEQQFLDSYGQGATPDAQTAPASTPQRRLRFNPTTGEIE